MGASLGETENVIASMFGFAMNFPKCIIVLDDIDRILGQQDNDASLAVDGRILQDDALPHSRIRLFASFLSHLDSLGAVRSSGNHQLLIVATASYLGTIDLIGRVDKVFSLDPPNDAERREIISQSLGMGTHESENSKLLTDLVDCTVGRSRSELVQYCRQAIASCSSSTGGAIGDRVDPVEALSNKDMLLTMKASLQSLTPESLRNGVVSDFVDMTVLTAQDLNVGNKLGSDEPQLALFGNDAAQAWDEMKALIVVPLCQANELDALLCGASVDGGKAVCGGVLLVGETGCGKGALAFHCARVAASLLPSVSLLDVSCTSLVHKEVGGSERAVRHLFTIARAAAPCILIMDGIENIAAVSGHDNTTEGTMDRILSTLLIELDGVESQSSIQDRRGGKIAIVGITHHEQWIDPALRRPGRLEKVIRLHNPDHDGRYQIILRELQSSPTSDSSSPDASNYDMELASFVADRTDGMSGAEVIALCRDARMERARECIKQNNELHELDRGITREHFYCCWDPRMKERLRGGTRYS